MTRRSRSSSKTCEPMCACTPCSVSPGIARSSSIAFRASPVATENPNFVSSWPVRTNSCVCASTPGVTRTRQSSGDDALTSVESSAISSKLSTTSRWTPTAMARSNSSADLLLPCMMMRPAGTPERSTRSSSPPGRDVDAETLFKGQSGHGAAEEGLRREGDSVVEGAGRFSTARAQRLLVVDEERRAVGHRRDRAARRRRSARRSR